MPLSQDRIITLIAIADESIAERTRLASQASTEIDEALAKFYANNGNDNPLAATILAHLQSLAATILDNPQGISAESISILAREREHFRVRRTSNTRAARSMARRRYRIKLPVPELPNFEEEV